MVQNGDSMDGQCGVVKIENGEKREKKRKFTTMKTIKSNYQKMHPFSCMQSHLEGLHSIKPKETCQQKKEGFLPYQMCQDMIERGKT